MGAISAPSIRGIRRLEALRARRPIIDITFERKSMPSYYLSEDLARFGDIAKTNPKLFDLFLKWYSETMEPGALDAKTKKLIAYAVANAIQEPYCIDSYASSCADAGISPEEMAEALNVAAVIRGGGTIAHWAQSMNTLARKK